MYIWARRQTTTGTSRCTSCSGRTTATVPPIPQPYKDAYINTYLSIYMHIYVYILVYLDLYENT